MDYLLILESTVGRARPYEIVVAVLLVVISSVALFFLYRNVTKHFRKRKKDQQAMNMNEESQNTGEKREFRLFSRSKDVETSDLKGRINYDILKSEEGDLRVLYSIDIDDFRTYVEKFEQKNIDKITNELEKRLIKYADKRDITGHLGKDKFIYYYLGECNSETITKTAKELLALLNEPLKVDD